MRPAMAEPGSSSEIGGRPVPVVPLAVAVAGAAVAAGAAGAAVWASGGVGDVEARVARSVHDLPGWVDGPLEVGMQAGTRGAVVVVALIVVGALGRRAGGVVALAGASAWALAAGGKLLELRDRPTEALLGRSVREHVAGSGYPSTHAAVATGLAVVLALDGRVPRPVRLAVGGLAVVTAVARVHRGVHWPLDVVGGAALGAVAAGSVVAVARGARSGGGRWGEVR